MFLQSRYPVISAKIMPSVICDEGDINPASSPLHLVILKSHNWGFEESDWFVLL